MRNRFLSEETEEAKDLMTQGRINSRLPLRTLPLQASALTGSKWLHAVEATIDGDKIRIRVIVRNRGINVTVPCNSKAMYQRFLDLRFRIRNMDEVLVTFDELYVQPCCYGGHIDLFLLAYDFKQKEA